MQNYTPIMGHFTVWEFRSVDGKQKVISVQTTTPSDFSHDYQTILWTGLASGKPAALDLYRQSKSGEHDAN